MNITVIPNSYILADTLAHRLPLSIKLFVLSSYIIFILTSQSPLTLLALSALILAVHSAMKLPVINKTLIFLTTVLLISALFASPKSFAVYPIIILGKLVCLMMVLAIFSMTTKPNDILLLVKPNLTASPLHLLSYITKIILAILPNIQYDLQCAIDVETLRRGYAIRFYSLRSWLTILTTVLMRGLSRIERLADTITNRCYSPAQGLTPLSVSEPSLKPTDIIRAMACVGLGFLIVILPL